MLRVMVTALFGCAAISRFTLKPTPPAGTARSFWLGMSALLGSVPEPLTTSMRPVTSVPSDRAALAEPST